MERDDHNVNSCNDIRKFECETNDLSSQIVCASLWCKILGFFSVNFNFSILNIEVVLCVFVVPSDFIKVRVHIDKIFLVWLDNHLIIVDAVLIFP